MAKKPAPKKAAPKAAPEVAMPSGPDRQHLTIRQISNGYIVNESGVKNGKYFEKETFTKTKPKVTM
jgi:hypothetical protein